jgi:HlyD family secretion protein
MDIPRETRSRRKPLMVVGIGVVAIVAVTVAVARLEPAAPTVDRSMVVLDSVVRGTLVRQVRAPGNLVPERIRYVPAVTAGRVERKLVQPGTEVEAGTVLLELSNPEVQLELLEAQRQLSAAEQQLVSLRTTLETQRLSQASVVATMRAQEQEASRNAAAAERLVRSGGMAAVEAATRIDRAEEYATRLAIEQERLDLMTESIGPQLEVQGGQVSRLRNIVAFHETRLSSMRVTAGMAGVLQDMALEEGQWVLPGQTLARVVDPQRLKAVLRVPQVQARDVVLGQNVVVDTRSDTIPGRVTRIDPAVEGGTVAVDAALAVALPQGARPDLAVDGTIEIERLPDVLYVGRPAYGQAESTVGLFKLVEGGSYAERVRVRLGRGSVNSIQVVEGLVPGDVVILSDMSRWDQYDRVRIR